MFFNILKIALKAIPHVVKIVVGIYNFFKWDKKKPEEPKNTVNKALNEKIKELNEQKAYYEERNYEYNERINELERLLRDNQQQLQEMKRQQLNEKNDY